MALLTGLIQSIRRLVTQPVGELNRAARWLRYAIDLSWGCARELRHDRAEEMAAALTYRTIFSLMPLLVLALLVFNAFGGFEHVRSEFQTKIYDYFGLSSLAVPINSPSTVTLTPTTQPTTTTDHASTDDPELRAKLDQIITGLTDQVSKLNFGSVGIVGLCLLIWAALSLVVTIEQSFNRIFNCPVGRPWHLRITIYWAVVTLGPVLFFLSLYLTISLGIWANSLGVLGPYWSQFTRLAALGASWLLLFLLFTLMPNTRVDRRAAMVGALVTAILYEIGKWGFGLYVSKALPYSRFYGSLALIPLFLFWIYVTWMIVLFGLELTYSLQAMNGRRFKHLDSIERLEQSANPQWLLPIMLRIAKTFSQGRSINEYDLAGELSLPLQSVIHLLSRLQKAGLVHRVRSAENKQNGVSLARSPDQITVAMILDLGHDMTIGHRLKHDHAQHSDWAYLLTLEHAQRSSSAGKTLHDLLP